MRTTRIFIASSNELKDDREAFRELLSLENDRLHYKGAYLELVQWEYFFNAVSLTSKQDDYNEELKKTDIVICLFYTKAGKYTQLEFDTALEQFRKTGAPLIYTYFKVPDAAIQAANNTPAGGSLNAAEEQMHKDLTAFKERLQKLGHFYTVYKNTEDLKLQFLQQLNMLQEKGLANLQEETKEKTASDIGQYFNNNAGTAGNNNTILQGNTGNVSVNNSTTTNQTAEKIINIEKIDNATFS